ncbi:hypothetical protein QE152_g3804 [Popillia japonica]|uniref:Uncharacterized protein n=1 Tax=Popillia japonica TaxID=7064 RepID=A0AAW1N390_POPJA
MSKMKEDRETQTKQTNRCVVVEWDAVSRNPKQTRFKMNKVRSTIIVVSIINLENENYFYNPYNFSPTTHLYQRK